MNLSDERGAVPRERGKTMSLKEQVVDFAIRNAIKYARKDFDRNAPNILSIVEKADVKRFKRS